MTERNIRHFCGRMSDCLDYPEKCEQCYYDIVRPKHYFKPKEE